MPELVIRVFAAFGILCALAVAGLAGWVLLSWAEDRRSRKRVPGPEHLTGDDCRRLLADLEAWDRGERP